MDGKQMARTLAATVIKLAVAVLVILLVYKLAVSAYTFGFRIFAEKPMTEGDGITVTVVYSETDSIRDLGQKLYDQGLIRDTKLFYYQEMFSDYHGIEQPGVYQLNTSMTVEEMLGVMAAGAGDAAENAVDDTLNQPADDGYMPEDTGDDMTDDAGDGMPEDIQDGASEGE